MNLLCTGTRYATIADHGLTVQKHILEAIPHWDTGPHIIYVGDNEGVEGTDGVDFIVRHLFGRRPGWRVREFKAAWEECGAGCPPREHRRRYRRSRGDYCPYAGPRRNRTMIREFAEAGGGPVLAFPAADARSTGTRGCVAEARRARLEVAPLIPLTVGVTR